MENQAFLIILAIFVAISAIALCVQAGMLYGIFKSAKATEEKVKGVMPKIDSLLPKVEAMLPKLEALVESSTAAVDMSRKQIHEITAKASDILDVTRVQLARIEDKQADQLNQILPGEGPVQEWLCCRLNAGLVQPWEPVDHDRIAWRQGLRADLFLGGDQPQSRKPRNQDEVRVRRFRSRRRGGGLRRDQRRRARHRLGGQLLVGLPKERTADGKQDGGQAEPTPVKWGSSGRYHFHSFPGFSRDPGA